MRNSQVCLLCSVEQVRVVAVEQEAGWFQHWTAAWGLGGRFDQAAASRSAEDLWATKIWISMAISLHSRFDNPSDCAKRMIVPVRGGVFKGSLFGCNEESLIEVSSSSMEVSDDVLEILNGGHCTSNEPPCRCAATRR